MPLPNLRVQVDGAAHEVPAEAAPVSLGTDQLCDIVLAHGPERLGELRLDERGWFLLVPREVGSVAAGGHPAEVSDDASVVPVNGHVPVAVRTEAGMVELALEETAAQPAPAPEHRGASAAGAKKKARRREVGEMPDEFAASWEVPEGKVLQIGRSGGPADVQVPDMEISIINAVARRSGDSLQVKWTGNGAGLSVAGSKVRRAVLAAGESFRMGHHRFWFTGKELGWEREDDPGYLRLHGLSVTHYGQKTPTTQDISFELPTGAFLAVLGPSGAGKSTIMAALLGEAKSEGFAILGGDPLGGGRMPDPSMASFVPQRGSSAPEMTVWQVLDITARMRLAKDLSGSERRERIEQTLERLGLTPYAKQRVHSLSGGQQRRLSVAMELITEPRLLILDEPTSGLDDGLDRTLMMDLRKVADSGTTVVVITHSMSHLDYATHVLALTGEEPQPGKVREPSHVGYFGPPEAMFEAFGATKPADVMDALREGRQVPSPLDLDPRTARPSAAPEQNTAARRKRHNLSLWRSYWVSLRRENIRQRINLAQVFFMAVIAPAVVGLIGAATSARGLGGTSANPNADLPTVMSVLVISLTFLSMALSLTSVVTDLPILVRERRWGVRSTGVVLARATVRVIPALIQPAVMLAVMWFLRPRPEQGLKDIPTLVGLYAPLALLTLAAMCIGLLISTVSLTAERAVGTMSALLAFMVILCGLVVPLGDSQGARKFLSWLSYATPTRWGVGSLGSFLDVNALTYMTDDPMWTPDRIHFLLPLGVLLGFALLALFLCAAVMGRVMTAARRRGI